MNDIESNTGEIVMYQPDETIRLEVRMDEDTLWLSQEQMADLFATDRSSIAKLILNIYETDELDKEATCAKIAQVRKEGKESSTMDRYSMPTCRLRTSSNRQNIHITRVNIIMIDS